MSKIRYGSVCSGIEAATVAWHPLGWEPQWFSEIEAFPSAVLAHRFPDVPNLGDMTKIHENETFKQSTIDLLVGGTPCQSFSVAGLRKGLDDPRGNLMLTFLAIAGRKRPRWVVWENVPGVLSSNGGRDFGTFLSGLAELGYGFAYRVLDAQYFGVAQRRRRVFVVGYLGDWRPAAAVLFERHGLSGHPAPRREKREGVAGGVEGGAPEYSWWNGGEVAATITTKSDDQRMPDKANAQLLVAKAFHGQASASQSMNPSEISPALDKSKMVSVMQPIAVDLYNQPINHETSQTISSAASNINHTGGVVVPQPTHAFKVRGGCEGGGKGYLGQDEAAFTISTGQDQMVAQPIKETADCLTASYGTKWNGNASAENGSLFAKQGTAIRRLLPVETERLQGFPDGWTQIPYRNKPADQCPDGPRYKACGNSMAVPVMRWIGGRINQVESILNQ